VLTQQTAQSTGLGVGDVISMDLYTPQQMGQIAEDTEVRPQGSHLDLTVVGIVRDSFDIAPGASDRMMIASPAFYEHHRATGDNVYAGFAVRTAAGSAGVDGLVDRLSDVAQPGHRVGEQRRDGEHRAGQHGGGVAEQTARGEERLA